MKVALLAALTACGSVEAPATMHARTGAVGYEMQDGWSRIDSRARGIATTVWTPAENPQRMSVTVIRTEQAPLVAAMDPNTLTGLLAQAQNGLDEAKMTSPTLISTAGGLHGARVEVDFVPPSGKARYHRSHIVLADGSALVHVMFTAQAADTFAALDTVLTSIRHEEGGQ